MRQFGGGRLAAVLVDAPKEPADALVVGEDGEEWFVKILWWRSLGGDSKKILKDL